MTGGTFRQLGTQNFVDFLNAVRTASAEGLDAANNRLLGPAGVWAFCGSTIWRNKISLGAAGGHGDAFDDGHYAQDLGTGNWEVLLPCSAEANGRAIADTYGEWTPGAQRPASQHTFFHLITVGDDLMLPISGAIGFAASRSGQGHRWKGSLNGGAGAWERYGNNHLFTPEPRYCHYDASRNRIVRIPLSFNSTISTIPANDSTASWTDHGVRAWPYSDIYQSIGYHEQLDCYVMVDQHQVTTRNRAWVLNPDDLATGWVEVAVQGSTPDLLSCGLEYVPPMRAFASASTYEPTRLYYLQPTGGRFGAWAWSTELFTGSVTAAPWEATSGSALNPQSRMRWSSSLRGLVLLKAPYAPTEIFTPSQVAGLQ